MLFVLAGYGDSLYDIWMNGVWGEVKQKWNPLARKLAPKGMTKGINRGSKFEAEMESVIKLSV